MRRAIVGRDLSTNVLATTLPFVVLLGLVGLIRYGGRPGDKHDGRE